MSTTEQIAEDQAEPSADATPTTFATAPATTGVGLRVDVLGRWGERLALPAVWIMLVIAFSIIRPDTFPTRGNVASILGSQSVLFVMALAALLPSMVGDIDLSLGGIGGLAAITLAVLNVRHGVPIGLACLIAVGVGATAGTLNGLLVVRGRTEPFIMTLGTGTFFTGLLFWIANSTTIVGVSRVLSEWTYLKRVFVIPIQFYYCVAIRG